jgi:hypothetical protein
VEWQWRGWECECMLGRWRHWLWRWREWHCFLKVDRIWHALCIRIMKLIVKYVLFLADVWFLGVIVDLDKYTVPWQMCFTWRCHLRLESYIQVNMTLSYKTVLVFESIQYHHFSTDENCFTVITRFMLMPECTMSSIVKRQT